MKLEIFYGFITSILQVASTLFIFIFGLMPLIEEWIPEEIKTTPYGNYLIRQRRQKLRILTILFLISVIFGISSIIAYLISPYSMVKQILGWASIFLFATAFLFICWLVIVEYLTFKNKK